jgi:DME family drug/metabolite transporter
VSARPRPELAIVAAAVLWGTTGTAQDLADLDASPVAVGVARIALGGLGLAVVALAVARRSRRAGEGAPARWWTAPGAPVALLAGMAAVAAYQASFFAAVDRAGVALGTLVAIGSGPVFTGLVALVAAGERPVGRWYPATGLAVVGCALLLAPGGDRTLDALGLALALSAGLSYAVYTVAAKALLGRRVPGPTVMAAFFLGGAVVLAPALVVTGVDDLAGVRGTAMTLWLGLATVTLSYVLFTAGLARLRSSTVATLSLTEPLTAALLGVVVLGERPGLVAATGALVLLGGLVVLATERQGPGTH